MSTASTTRVALVTGATGAIGEAIARQLAELGDLEVVLAVRDEAKGRRVLERIRRATSNERVRVERVDMSRRVSVDALAERWSGPLHVLVNNAAIAPRRRELTPEGLELQFATNILGYVWLTLAFEAALTRSAPARVINVASYWAGDLRLDDLQFEQRRYDNNTAYRQSKQANRMLTVALADRLEGTGVTVNACHPGDVSSSLSNALGFGGSESPDEGADTPVWLAIGAEGGRVTGRYFADRREQPCRFAADRLGVDALYQACLRYA